MKLLNDILAELEDINPGDFVPEPEQTPGCACGDPQCPNYVDLEVVGPLTDEQKQLWMLRERYKESAGPEANPIEAALAAAMGTSIEVERTPEQNHARDMVVLLNSLIQYSIRETYELFGRDERLALNGTDVVKVTVRNPSMGGPPGSHELAATLFGSAPGAPNPMRRRRRSTEGESDSFSS